MKQNLLKKRDFSAILNAKSCWTYLSYKKGVAEQLNIIDALRYLDSFGFSREKICSQLPTFLNSIGRGWLFDKMFRPLITFARAIPPMKHFGFRCFSVEYNHTCILDHQPKISQCSSIQHPSSLFSSKSIRKRFHKKQSIQKVPN